MTDLDTEPSRRSLLHGREHVDSPDVTRGAARWAQAPSMAERVVRRIVAGTCLVALGWYSAFTILVSLELPLWARLIWLATVVGACLAPHLALCAFLIVAPLTARIPASLHWATVSPPEQLAIAVLLPALAICVYRPAPAGVPKPLVVLTLIATASLVTSFAPASVVWPSLWDLTKDLHEFAGRELFVTTSFGHVYYSLRSFVVFCAALGTTWYVLWSSRQASHAPVERAFFALVAGAVLVSLLGIRQWWTGSGLLAFWLEADPYLTRTNSTFSDVNGLGSYLVGVLPILALVHYETLRTRWAARAAAGVIILAIVFTGSRAAWLATASCLGVVIWRQLASRPEFGPRSAVRATAALAVLCAVAFAGLTTLAVARDVRPGAHRSYFDVVLYSLNPRLSAEERLKGRWAYWHAAWRMIREHPVGGIGIGRYPKDLAAYAANPESLPRRRDNAHNYFLQTAAELGLPAVALLFAAVLLPMTRALRFHGGSVTEFASAGAVGIGLSASTWLTGHPLLVPEGQLMFWSQVGLVLSAARSRLAPAVQPAPAHRRLAWMVVVAVSTLAIPARFSLARTRVDASRLMLGVAESNRDETGRDFWWTEGLFTFFVPSESTRVRFAVRSGAPEPQVVELRVDGEPADKWTVDSGPWHELAYTIPPRTEQRFRRFELRITPTFRRPNDAADLGIMVAGPSWE